MNQDKIKHKTGTHLAEKRGSRGSGPLPFSKSLNCALKFLNQFRRNALKIQFKKRKNSPKRYINSILLNFPNATLRSILKRGSHQQD